MQASAEADGSTEQQAKLVSQYAQAQVDLMDVKNALKMAMRELELES